MSNRQDINLQDWLVEFDIPAAAAQPDPAGMQAPMTDPNQVDQFSQQEDPNVANMNQLNNPQPEMPDQTSPDQEMDQEPEDISNDPQVPDMPEEKKKVDDFEVWKKNFMKASVKSNISELLDMVYEIRDDPSLTPYQNKFVEDNLNVLLLRRNSNIEKASGQIRKQIKEQLDRSNPSTSLVNHIYNVLEANPELKSNFIKLKGYAGLKGDLHRKFIAALTGSVQVGSGGDLEDLVYNDREYSILISTRFNAQWGDVLLSSWSLKEDDPQRYLTDPEIKRMNEGSPEERQVLRKRLVVESICELLDTRAFVVNVVGEDGTIYYLGWDVANSLKSAYTDGKIVVKTRKSEAANAMITDDGDIVPLMDIDIYYVEDTTEIGENGEPIKNEMLLMERRNGMLFLVADLNLIRKLSTSLIGISFKEAPYTGNPSDLKVLERCVYTSHDLLMRQC